MMLAERKSKYGGELKYGLIIGALAFIWLICEYLFGLHDKHLELFFIVTNFVFIIPLIGIYLAISAKKKNSEHKPLTFKRGFVTGLIISLTYSVVSAIGQFIYHQFINPGYFDHMVQTSVAKGYDHDQALLYFNTSNFVITVFMSYLFVGIIISLIVSLILKSKRNN